MILITILLQCDSLGGKAHSPSQCHMAPALSSLKYLGTLLVKKNETSDLKRKQKLLRSMKVKPLMYKNYLNFIDHART